MSRGPLLPRAPRAPRLRRGPRARGDAAAPRARGERRALRACAVLLALAWAAPARAQSRLAFVEIEVRGPFTGAVLDGGAAGETVVEGALGPGEVRRLVVPVPRASPGAGPPSVRAEGDSVRVLGPVERDARFDALPAALRARALPATPEDRVRASPALLALLAAALVVGLAARARAALALGAALVLGAGAFALAARARGEARGAIEVLDGLAGNELWLGVRAARGAVDLVARGPACELRTEPARAALRVRAALDPGRPFRVESPGARLFVAWVEAWPDDAIEPAGNALLALSAAWVREDGRWTARGAWPLGAPLPSERAPGDGDPAPPGWLASGLPQASRFLVARAESRMGERWVRCAWP